MRGQRSNDEGKQQMSTPPSPPRRCFLPSYAALQCVVAFVFFVLFVRLFVRLLCFAAAAGAPASAHLHERAHLLIHLVRRMEPGADDSERMSQHPVHALELHG